MPRVPYQNSRRGLEPGPSRASSTASTVEIEGDGRSGCDEVTQRSPFTERKNDWCDGSRLLSQFADALLHPGDLVPRAWRFRFRLFEPLLVDGDDALGG